MWRNLSKQPSLRKLKSSIHPSNCSTSEAPPIRYSDIIRKSQRRSSPFSASIFRPKDFMGSQKDSILRVPFVCYTNVRAYAGAAAQLISSASEEDDEDYCSMQEFVEQLNKEFHRVVKDLYFEGQRQEKKRVLPEEDVEQNSEIQDSLEEMNKEPKKRMRDLGSGKYGILRRRQIKMETEAWRLAAQEYQDLLTDMCEQKLAPNLPYMKSLFLGWFEPLRDAIAADQKLCRERKAIGIYARYFDQLPADMMAVITMHQLMGLLMTEEGSGSARVVQAASIVGKAIEQEIRIYNFLEKTKKKKTSNKISEEVPDLAELQQDRARKKVNMLMKKQKVHQVRKIVKHHDDSITWSKDAAIQVGCRLIQILIETAFIQPPLDRIEDGPPDIRPAFRHLMRIMEGPMGLQKYGVIECDPLVRKGLEKTARHMVIPYMPMLVPPQNWTGYDKGAYLFLPSYIMRVHGAKQQRQALKRALRNQLKPVCEALNTLGATKWRINTRILNVVDKIWACGGGLADLVEREDLPLPEEPDTEDVNEIRKWKRTVKNIQKENSERHSQRCAIEVKLSVSRKMKDEAGFYYPHNLDFRGRAYPIHPHLNHLGSDLSRGILQFAEGRPLGKSGLRWLKIHLANIYGTGVDKLSYEGRIAFTESHLDDIFDSADRPLEGRRWWLKAEDPFQCLATCMNLCEALRSPSPETTLSHTPIHQDGSCNGLQHYAALGRDTLGAVAVNLVSGDKPADVYSEIAGRVLEIMRRDAEKDPEANPNALQARLLLNQVDRKLVKQTVMTSVYGVTYIGARDQILKRLKERTAIEDETQLFSAACYAAKTTLTALGEMFEAARDIMNWLSECAKIISLENQPVRWTTPLGLPVVQPYHKLGRRMVRTSLQSLAVQIETDKVLVQRQKSAFAPNFIHSLDGSHMMMTAIACKEAGLTFAGVHDSYWTHACDVDQMNKILREKFVELYEAPILENLLESFQKSFPKLKFPPLPERGDFDLREVAESTYFFN